MAQISQALYNTIADAYAAIDTALAGISTNARTALDAIVDVDTADYPDPSAASADAALEIELALLQTFNNAYVAAGNIENSNASLLDAVTAVNDFVITNEQQGATASAKIAYWINTRMASWWTSSYCPDGWANISRDAGYSVVGWMTVSEPGGLSA